MGAELFEKEQEMLDDTVYITKDEATFMEIDSESENVEIVENKPKKKPLLIRRVLSEEDLDRLKELRVTNLMKLWNRKREEVGLKEERESDDEIDVEQEVESLTTLKLKKKEQRKNIMKNGQTSKQKTWDEYRKQKGGGSTNKEKQRK